jgi:hypothetical protein
MTEMAARRLAGRPTQALEQRQVRLERAIRDHCRQFPGAAGRPTAVSVPVEQLAGSLGDRALIEYVELDGHLGAVTLVDGRAAWRSLGPVERITEEMTHLPFALHRLANRTTRAASRAAAQLVLERTGAYFDSVLLEPLRRVLAGRPLLVVPSSSLHSLPWSIVPSCADRPVTVSPSALIWRAAATRPAADPGSVVVVAGPGLPGASQEAGLVAARYADARELTGADATVQQVSAAMSGAGLVHLAAHGAVRADNPLFSAIQLADGPLTIYDLERLRRAPHRVVLASCETGRDQVITGDELLGFSAALLSCGTANLVAPVVPVPDVETAPLMELYHGYAAKGYQPAEALARTQQDVRTDDPLISASAAGFVCLGAG